jgi:hypothetical protein
VSGVYTVKLWATDGSCQHHTGATSTAITLSDDDYSIFAEQTVDVDVCVEYGVEYSGHMYHIGLTPHYIPGMQLLQREKQWHGLSYWRFLRRGCRASIIRTASLFR